MFKWLTIILIISILNNSLFAAEICSRVATVNYQEVLVDTNSSQKGEGLRYFLSKDKKASEFLNRYQEGTKIKWQTTLLGSVGTILFISGLFSSKSSSNKTTLMGVGAGIIALNIVVSKTLEQNNEINLIRAIEEYNKRHIPRIYFNAPYNPNSRGPSSYSTLKRDGFVLNFIKEF